MSIVSYIYSCIGEIFRQRNYTIIASWNISRCHTRNILLYKTASNYRYFVDSTKDIPSQKYTVNFESRNISTIVLHYIVDIGYSIGYGLALKILYDEIFRR